VHTEAYEFVRDWVGDREFEFVVEFGSLDINGSVRRLFGAANYWGIDLQRGPGVNEVADAAEWRAVHPRPDCIVCCEVLEHTPDIVGIFMSAFRNLESGGHFVVTCAIYPREPHSAVDGGPIREDEFYRNVDLSNIRELARVVGFDLDQIEINLAHGDLYMVLRKP